MHDLKVFGDGEHYSEHSTLSLRYVLIPVHQADIESKSYPNVDDPERLLSSLTTEHTKHKEMGRKKWLFIFIDGRNGEPCFMQQLISSQFAALKTNFRQCIP